MNPDQLSRIEELAGRVIDDGVIGIVRAATAEAAQVAARAMVESGLGVVEVSLVTPGALGVISRLVTLYPDALIGAGTVMTDDEARASVDAGARLLVSPTVDPAVLARAAQLDVLAIPGANTPTECVAATRLGAALVKLFPASTWSPGAVADLRAALPALRLVPTGGVRLDDAVRWYRAGAVALGIGSALSSGTSEECRERVRNLRAARAESRENRTAAVAGPPEAETVAGQ